MLAWALEGVDKTISDPPAARIPASKTTIRRAVIVLHLRVADPLQLPYAIQVVKVES
jgi:hypothetical protein